MTDATLPIDAIHPDFDAVVDHCPVVITSPTGSGKSTQVPSWCRGRGRVLVIEPRRVACRSLAVRVAQLEGEALGGAVGYTVRDEHKASARTEILFATTGVALRMLGEGSLDEFTTVIVDELHERSLEIDLILALLCLRRGGRGVVVMSATLEGDRVAEYIGGELLTAEGRLHPVEIRYHPGQALVPTAKGLEGRLLGALEAVSDRGGDVLVFLPGKAEIGAAASALSRRSDLLALPLHGGLTLEEQSRAFAPSDRRKVILATNVAETSVTVPGVEVVIDSGLVRRTRYHQGRGFLTLSPIALDSATQRAGRAGRTAPGRCLRLWSEAAMLEATTPPEIHRESLTPLLLAARACGAAPETLPFLDPPKDYALESAREELSALGALDRRGELTERGRRLFGLPVDAALGRLLVEAEARGTLDDAIDLVAALTVGRPVFSGPLNPEHDVDDDPRAAGCDVTALIRLLRASPKRQWRARINGFVLAEARQISRRLRHAFGLRRRLDDATPLDRERLARTALAADPRCAHIARERRNRIGWSNGGTELELARESAVAAHQTPAIAVLDSRAIGTKRRKTQIIATCAIPLELRWLVDAGLGQDRLRGTELSDGQLVAKVERVFARRVIEQREELPKGDLARAAVAELFLKGELFPETLETARGRLEALGLLDRLRQAGLADEVVALQGEELPEAGRRGQTLERWLLARLEELGLDSGDDLALLEPGDLLPPALPPRVRQWLDRAFPRELSLGDVRYQLDYDLQTNEVTLVKIGGRRQQPPPASYLPAFPGFRVVLRDRSRVFVLRER